MTVPREDGLHKTHDRSNWSTRLRRARKAQCVAPSTSVSAAGYHIRHRSIFSQQVLVTNQPFLFHPAPTVALFLLFGVHTDSFQRNNLQIFTGNNIYLMKYHTHSHRVSPSDLPTFQGVNPSMFQTQTPVGTPNVAFRCDPLRSRPSPWGVPLPSRF